MPFLAQFASGKTTFWLLAFLFLGWVILQIQAVDSRASQKDDKTKSQKLHQILHEEWQRFLKDNPTFASDLGDLRYNTRWPEVSFAELEKQQQHRKEVLQNLDQIDMQNLASQERINYQLFRKKIETEIEEYPYRWYLLPLTQREGIQTANNLTETLRFETAKDYEDWLARLESLPVYMDQTIALMRAGIKAKKVHPRIIMDRIPAQIARQIVKEPEKSLFYKPFRDFPKEFKAADKKRLQKQAQNVIAAKVVPAYEKLQSFFTKEYLPACFERVGVWQMPDGQDFYAFRARKYTTTKLTPKQIHDIGLKEVARIKQEMIGILNKVKFKGTFKEFLTDLRTNPKFFTKNKDELFKAYQEVCKKIDAGLPKIFHRLPKIPFTIKPIPMHIAPDTTTAYYQPPAADGSRSGVYYVNLYKLEARPLYEIGALSAHEAQPGHHLQIALAMELQKLPEFRRYDYDTYTAFVEGWGLYSEKLGEEIGLYQDPYSKFGQLTYQMWRACRLVVDTGMHAFEWSRQQAIDFMVANTPKTILDI